MSATNRSRSLVVLSLLLAALSSSLAGQTVRNHLYDKFQVGASVTSVILGTTIRIDGSQSDIGTEVDAEDDLGLSTSKIQPRFDFRWRPGRRHELEVGYQFARRSADRQLERDFNYSDTTYTAGLRVKSSFATDQAFLNYRFAFMAREKTQVGIGLGLGTLLFDTQIDGMANAAGGGKSDSVAFSRSSNLVGPTASLGFFGHFMLGDAWYLEADLRGVKVAIDRFDAKVVEGGAAGRYFVSSRLGLEAGYGISSITVEVAPKSDSGPGASGKISYSLQHIRLGLVYAL